MAGAGFKIFQNGNTLTATEVNTYMMEQQMMVFANAAARDAALIAPSEGMHAFLKDTDKVTFYDGSVWRNL
jgi:hypothetical protein